MKKRLVISLTFGILIILGVYFYRHDVFSSTTEIKNTFKPENTSTNKKIITIGVVVHNLEHQFMANVTSHLLEEAKNYDNINLIVLDSAGSSTKQMNQIDYLIEKKVDGIILNPNDNQSLDPSIKKIQNSKIPLVIVNMKVNNSYNVPYIGTDDETAGEIQGKYIVDALNGKGKILLLCGAPNQIPTIERYNGLMKVLNNYPNIKILDKAYGNWERYTGSVIMEKWINNYSNTFDLVVSQNDEMILGALPIIEKHGLKTNCIGIDGIPEAIEAIKEGRLSASVFQDAKSEAELSLKIILAKINNEKTEDIPNVHYELITSQNVNEYLNETNYANPAKK